VLATTRLSGADHRRVVAGAEQRAGRLTPCPMVTLLIRPNSS
jgi:hypothetical protein